MEEYKSWLSEKHGAEISKLTEAHYQRVALKVRSDFEASAFWCAVKENLREFHDQYLLQTEYPLLVNESETPPLITKPFNSFLLKTFRRNILENSRWPNPPEGGWITPKNWLESANDVVRTCLMVKYLDGVEFLISSIKDLAAGHNLESQDQFKAGVDGYYAAHLYVRHDFEIPPIGFDTQKISMKIEIQVTSQLQEVIRTLLHRHFENRRDKPTESRPTWQWDYRGTEFATNYLGHILHYVEGMIMDVRDRKRKSEAKR